MKRKFYLLMLSFIFAFSFSMLLQASTGSCAPKKAKINVKKLTLAKTEDYTLRVYNMKKNQTVKFVTEDDDIVLIQQKNSRSKTATITASNTGTAVIRANVYNKKGRLVRSLKTTIKVTPFAISIKFTQKKVNLKVAGTRKLSIIIKPNTSQEAPIFESSDTDIVTVNSKGVITAVSSGEAYITATLLSSGQRVRCRVIVDEPDDKDKKEQDTNDEQAYFSNVDTSENA
nr:Ig-like domain-containing protein [Eubacterium sp.]